MRNIDNLRHLCLQSKEEVFANLGHPLPCREGNLHFADNGSQILGVCHVDTVDHKPAFRQKRNKVFSTALDDRLGIFVLTELLPAKGITLDWLFTDNEECGRSTAAFFDAPREYNWIVEFDRQGTDVVMYQYDDGTLDDPLEACGLKVGFGSYSDICDLSHLGVKAFNLGIGYHRQHSPACFADLRDTEAQVERFAAFYRDHKDERLPYDAEACEGYLWGDYWNEEDYYEEEYRRYTIGDYPAYGSYQPRLRLADAMDEVAYWDAEHGPIFQSEVDALDMALIFDDLPRNPTPRQKSILANRLQ